MQINLKTTILFSSLLAVVLNIGQFAMSYQQRKDAFAPSWTYNANPTPSPIPGKATVIASSPTPNPIAATPRPTSSTTASVAATLARAGLKSDFADLYVSVQQKTGTPWQLLAAVHRAETTQSGDTTRASYAGARGPMQFMPATFAAYGQDGDANGTKDIYDVDDAMLSAGRYLASGGAARGQYSNALYRYNHSWTYVSNVTATARRLGL